MMSEEDYDELTRESIQEQVDPEHNYCGGCGALLNTDTNEEVFCVRCE